MHMRRWTHDLALAVASLVVLGWWWRAWTANKLPSPHHHLPGLAVLPPLVLDATLEYHQSGVVVRLPSTARHPRLWTRVPCWVAFVCLSCWQLPTEIYCGTPVLAPRTPFEGMHPYRELAQFVEIAATSYEAIRNSSTVELIRQIRHPIRF